MPNSSSSYSATSKPKTLVEQVLDYLDEAHEQYNIAHWLFWILPAIVDSFSGRVSQRYQHGVAGITGAALVTIGVMITLCIGGFSASIATWTIFAAYVAMGIWYRFHVKHRK
jgi:hypothetical protein